jgi:hypothetical protein
MAKRKEYAYFLKGNNIAIVQRDFDIADGLNYVYDAAKGLEIGSGSGSWKSPIEAVSDGLEIEYAYSPTYHINDIEDKSTGITGYDESSGLLKFTGSGLSTDAAIKYIVIRGSSKWNGLHEINTLNASYWIVNTKYNGGAVTESGITAYTDINALNNEDDDIPVSEYLSKAVIDFVKAKIAEDKGEIELKEYFMKQFYKKVEKHQNSRISGSRAILAGANAIK